MGARTVDLADRLWAESLQEVQDAMARALGVPLLFVDPAGRPLAVCEDVNEFCRWFTRALPLLRPCLECGRPESLTAARGATGSLAASCQVHSCPLGVADAAVPIWSAGDIIGYLATAQVRRQEDSEEALPATSSRAGCGRTPDLPPEAPGPSDAEEHLALLNRLPSRSQSVLEQAAAGLAVVAFLLGSLASARRRNLKLAERIREQTRWIQANESTDAVTGLANRRHFCAMLEAELARVRRYQRSLSLAVLDVRDFRHINEEFGHEAGDGVLRAIARTLAATLRQTDMIGRLGGDEFGVLFTETGREGAMIALARIATQIEDLNASGELPVEVGLQVGLCEYALGVQDLLAAAVEELEKAKQKEGLPT